MSIYTIVICTRGDKAQRLSGGSEGSGALVMRGVEFGAAGLVLLFGAGLLFGYLAAERVTCLYSMIRKSGYRFFRKDHAQTKK